MTKQISLGVFEMMNPNNGMPTWTHPLGKGDRYDTVDYWVGVAKTLDANGVDFLFFADTYGYATIDGVMPDLVAKHGIQFPGFDPMLLISALARETTGLGFVLTSPTTVERPYATARRFATLDHYTGGRIGWNIVTGSSQATTDDLFGVSETTTHDERYDVADEFVDVCLELWEGVWEDDALVRDASTNTFADPAKLHPIDHEGAHFRARGVFAIPPGPQRSPVLFQAGTSERGRAFAARNAEAVLIQGQTVAKAAAHVLDIREQAVAHGREPHDVKVVTGVTITVAPTHDEAVAKRQELENLYTVDDAAVIFAGFTGVDLTGFDPASPLTAITSDQGQTLVDRFVRPGEPVPTVGDVLDDFRMRANRGFQITGDPVEVADELQRIVDGSDVDGIMLEPTFGGPEAFEEFLELVAPILRERGMLAPLPAAPEPTSLRERVTGAASRRLPGGHPGARFRHETEPVAG
ncbi:NtaA/DmoA family FMN-dependent monooxygenase [Frondihabitans australicus]|uniref:FMN-dependent oxidoreductase (Nitrilotriacetate monooxygenase family) n=1 Tax=Frondihabitans australicus TaxID=386892 RepID=A0A495IG06_9MICO|nr:NtaA/DmoA family FMN-dependent monooxygenase [Frondihabitans australicus]RKR74952.1 FMN-dependent oxidoreductase (nitrilotriacetate monooxygenase family) [Frondihabitans australicus]